MARPRDALVDQTDSSVVQIVQIMGSCWPGGPPQPASTTTTPSTAQVGRIPALDPVVLRRELEEQQRIDAEAGVPDPKDPNFWIRNGVRYQRYYPFEQAPDAH